MAPKIIESSKKRKGKEPATSSYNAQRFRSKLHEKHFYEHTYEKAVTPEVGFALQLNEYPEIQFQIQRRGPKSIRQALHQPPPDHVSACYIERMHRDQQLDQVLEEICIPGSQWSIGAEGKLNQLKSTDLLLMARRWLDFIRRSIMPISNRSECTVDRDIMIHCIMKGEIVENIASNPLKKTRLGFPHLIYCLSEAVKVKVDNDFCITVERPITKKTVEHLREHHRVSREDQVEEKAQQDHPPLL
ncbi:hypothetical protein AHAS_Ahas13G0275400 [Arachis hypogaea]